MTTLAPTRRASLSLLTVCGLEELDDLRERRISHILSILDPGIPEPESFERYDRHHRTTLRFNDIIEPTPGMILPEKEHAEQIVAFGEEVVDDLEEGREGHLLIHCHMGISRSTAAMITMLAMARPDEDEERVLERLVEIRPYAWPNIRLTRFVDGILGRSGRLTNAVRRHHGRRLAASPNLATIFRDLGRGAEVDGAIRPEK
jgi:predicted protein tyrosine phosphatase